MINRVLTITAAITVAIVLILATAAYLVGQKVDQVTHAAVTVGETLQTGANATVTIKDNVGQAIENVDEAVTNSTVFKKVFGDKEEE